MSEISWNVKNLSAERLWELRSIINDYLSEGYGLILRDHKLQIYSLSMIYDSSESLSAYGYIYCLILSHLENIELLDLKEFILKFRDNCWVKSFDPLLDIDELYIQKLKDKRFILLSYLLETEPDKLEPYLITLPLILSLVNNSLKSIEFFEPWELALTLPCSMPLNQLIEITHILIEILFKLNRESLFFRDLNEVLVLIFQVFKLLSWSSPWGFKTQKPRLPVYKFLNLAEHIWNRLGWFDSIKWYDELYQYTETPLSPTEVLLDPERSNRETPWKSYLPTDLDYDETKYKQGLAALVHDLRVVATYFFQKVDADSFINHKIGKAITNMIKVFDSLSYYVKDIIIKNDNPKIQNQLFNFFLELSYECFKHMDYHSSLSIWLSLTNGEIENKMNQTLKQIKKRRRSSSFNQEQNKYRLIYFKMSQLLSPVNNFAQMRSEMNKNQHKGAIPFIGIFTQDAQVLSEKLKLIDFKTPDEELRYKIKYYAPLLEHIYNFQQHLKLSFRVSTDFHRHLITL